MKIKMTELPLIGFKRTPLELERRAAWEALAAEIINKLRSGNVALVVNTSGGKTVMAFLAIIEQGWRTLFLVPQCCLTEQHQELLDRVSGHTIRSRKLTGHIRKRVWNDRTDQIVFATPQVVDNDWKRGLVELRGFDLVVIDEFHKAIGKYSYVPVAKKAEERGLRILALSASPGGSLERIELVGKNCAITHWLRPVTIKTAPKEERLEMVALDQPLEEIDHYFKELLQEAALDLAGCDLEVPTDKLATISELKRLREEILSSPHDELYFEAISAYARYFKLRHAYFLAISESYQAFFDYLEKLGKRRTKATNYIFNQPEFHQIVSLARRNSLNHPKVYRLLDLLTELKMAGKNALVFVGIKDTARGLRDFLARIQIRTEVAFGGKDKNSKRLLASIAKLKNREIDCLLATSVMEEGISVSEIDAVIQYSMPQTEIARLQRSGRTGRLTSGLVIYLAIDHPIDKVRFYGTRARLRRMREIIGHVSPSAPATPEEAFVPYRKYKRKVDRTMLLF